jgi:hypothetical protein
MRNLVFYSLAGLVAAGMIGLATRPVWDAVEPAAVAGTLTEPQGIPTLSFGPEELARMAPGGPAAFVTSGRGAFDSVDRPAVRIATQAMPETARDALPLVRLGLAPQALASFRGKDVAVQITGRIIPVTGPESLEVGIEVAGQPTQFATIGLGDGTGDSSVLLRVPDADGAAAIVFRPIPRSGEYPNGVELEKLKMSISQPPALRGR